MLYNVQNYVYAEMIGIILLVITAAITNSFILDGKRIGFKVEFIRSLAIIICLQLGYFSPSMYLFLLCYAIFTLLVSTFILFSKKDSNIISPV
jgi:hypothetical protein